MKKILFILNKYEIGGLEKVNMTIASSLGKEFSTTVYFQKSSENFSAVDKTIRFIIGKNNKVHFFKNPVLFMKAILTRKIQDKKNLIFNKVKSEIDFTNYDVVILNSEDILYASYIQQINPEVKIIWWVHNEYDIIMNRRLGDATNEVRNNLKFVDTVVTLTEFDKREFEDLHKNVVTIKNPLTINQGKVLSSLDSRVISFTSRLVFEQKGLDLLVQIAKKIEPGWKISVAGDGPDRQMFLQLIEKEKISDKFIFEGMLDKEALRLHYLNSSLFISTSRWEGFGLVITEAMSCGLPIISFDNKGPREILANGEFGILIEKYNIYDFVEKINYLISSKEYRRELANKSLERVKEYSLTKVTEEWKGIL